MSLSDRISKVRSGGFAGATVLFTDEVKSSIGELLEELKDFKPTKTKTGFGLNKVKFALRIKEIFGKRLTPNLDSKSGGKK